MRPRQLRTAARLSCTSPLSRCGCPVLSVPSAASASSLYPLQGHAVVVAAILEHATTSGTLGDVLERRDVRGATPLGVACSHRRLGAMSALLRAGANATARDRSGVSCAISWAAAPRDQLQAYSLAFATGVIAQLVAGGADLDARTTAGVCAVIAAVKSGQEAFAIALVEAGAAWGVRDADVAPGVPGETLGRLASDARMEGLVSALRARAAAAAPR